MDFCEVHSHRHRECHGAVEHEALVAEVGEIESESRTEGSEADDAGMTPTDETASWSAADGDTSLLGALGDSSVGRNNRDRNGTLPLAIPGSAVSV